MRMPSFALASLVAALAPLVLAAPTLVYPLQAQRPPVARSGESWTFTLLSGTFSSSSGGVLTLATTSTLPTWATFDASSGSFSGTPTSSDLGSVAVAVRATDASDGATTTGRFTLLVVDPASDPAPYVRLPLESQLASAAAISGGGTLTPGGALKVPPQWSFSFGFEQYTIENALQQRMYYTAFVHGTTSLPSWITFDNETVTFNGLAPYTPGEYEVDVVASERFGYGDARQSFTILVTKHAFELVGTNGTGDGVFPTVNATVGGPVNYTVPLDQLRLDNSTVNATDISSASADFAQADVTFLALDAATLSVTGEVPANYSPTSTSGVPIPLTLVDRNNDTLQANLSLVVYPSLFDTASFPAMIDVQVGKKFEQDLSAYLASTSSSSSKRSLPSSLEDVTFNSSIAPAAAASWLSFDSSAFTLSGTAPSSVPDYQNVSVTLDALDPTTSAISRASFVLSVIEGGGNSTFPTSSPSADKGLSSSAKLGLGLGLGLGLPLLILALVLVACCIRKRRRSDGADGSGGKSSRRPGGLLISHPRPMSTSPAPNGAFSASAVTIVGSAGHGGGGGGKGEKASPPVLSSAGWGSAEKGYVPAVGGAEHMALPVAVASQYPHAPHKLDTLHEADEPPPTPTEPKGPKRFDVMGRLFRSESGQSFLDAVRGKGKGRERSQRSLASLGGGAGAGGVGGGGAAVRHEASLFGLGIDDPASDETRRIVVVLEGGRGVDGTYASPKAGPAAGASGRVSSWESGASSSLFYSDRSAASGSPRSMPHRRTASRTGSASGSGLGSGGYGSPVPSASSGSSNVSAGGTRRGPPSIPQRRRDFLPLPLKSPTAPNVDSPAPSPTRDTYDVTPPLNLARDVSSGTMSDGVEEDEAAGGIRMVGSHSGSSGSSQDRRPDTSVAMSEARHFQQYSSPSRSGSYPSDSPSQDSLVAPPRLISFTQERRPPPFSRTFTSQTSLAARRPSEPTDTEQREDGDEAVEDAWEDDEGDDRPRPRSAVYVPGDGQGSPTTSAVFYPSAAAASPSAQRETWQSRSAYGDSVLSRTSFDNEILDEQRLSATGGGGVRYVGSVASTNVSPAMASHFTHDSASRYSQSDVPATPRSIAFSAASSQPTAATSADSRHKRSSSYLEPLRVSLHVGEPFRFVPRLEPAPFASISSSPGRNGPPRATYHAWIETALLDEALARRFSADELDDGIAPLPDWVHFDGAAIEVFGLARRIDAGTWPLVVVERKAQRTPGSPARAGGARASEDADVTEQVVGRFELVVAHRDGDVVGLGVAQDEDEGELRIVTY